MKIKTTISLLAILTIALFATAFAPTPKPGTLDEAFAKKERFIEFLSLFKKAELPYWIDLGDLDGYDAYRSGKGNAAKPPKVQRSIKSMEFIPEARVEFSRMGPPEIIPLVRFYPNDKMVAVIYSSKLRFTDNLIKCYNLILYDLNGNILTGNDKHTKYANMFNLAYSGVNESMTCMINAKGQITLTEFTNQWKKDLTSHGVEGNKVVGFKKGRTTTYSIGKSGKIQETKQDLASTRP